LRLLSFKFSKDKKNGSIDDISARLRQVESSRENKKNKKDHRKVETATEVEARFARLRQSRAKERHGPDAGGTFTYADINDSITDEELEYYSFGTTDPEEKAAIFADTTGQYQEQIQRCEEWKKERDSKTILEKREARQRVHNYTLRFDDDDEEQRKNWEQKFQQHMDAHPGIRKSVVEGWTELTRGADGCIYVNGEKQQP
jgi:hypothetical protein